MGSSTFVSDGRVDGPPNFMLGGTVDGQPIVVYNGIVNGSPINSHVRWEGILTTKCCVLWEGG